MQQLQFQSLETARDMLLDQLRADAESATMTSREVTLARMGTLHSNVTELKHKTISREQQTFLA